MLHRTFWCGIATYSDTWLQVDQAIRAAENEMAAEVMVRLANYPL